MTPETKTPTRAEALAALEMIKNNVDHVAKHPDMQDFVRRIRLYFPQIEAALSATDAPIVDDELISEIDDEVNWNVATRPVKTTESIVRQIIRLYAQGRTQSAVPEITGEMFYIAMHKDKGAVWAANECQDLWNSFADNLKAMLSAAPPVTGGAWLPNGWNQLIADSIIEADKAMRKFPQPNYVISKIAEEAGEVVKAAIHCAEGRETHQNLRGEMKQLIAMLRRLWVEGDEVHGLAPVGAEAYPDLTTQQGED